MKSSKSPASRANGDGSAKLANKQPHMARFHSLRSMLFQQRIEDQMKKVTQEDARQDMSPAEKWRCQHQDRQMHHPTTPAKDAQAKSGLGSRLKMTLRRMTTKDASGMEKIREDGAPVQFNDRQSTASDKEEKEQHVPETRGEPDNESINDSDVDELVRWVSTRDSSSHHGARKEDTANDAKEDSGHESLGPSDVDELVHYARRKSDAIAARRASDQHSGYGDASTESDNEVSSGNEEDADDLVRWISHRDGQQAGPQQRHLRTSWLDSDVEEHYDTDVPELGRWFTRYDGTSGESRATSPVQSTFDEQIQDEEENRGRPRSRDLPEPGIKEKTHLTHDDIEDLVRWVSRKDVKLNGSSTPELQDSAETLDISDEDEKKEAVGMTLDQGSLSHSDVQELLEHIQGRSRSATENETGDLNNHTLHRAKLTTTPRNPQQELAQKRDDLRKREKELDINMQDSSLSNADIEDLVAHLRS